MILSIRTEDTKNGSSEKLLPPLKWEPQTENAVKVNKRAKGQTLFGERDARCLKSKDMRQ